ncbi:MAG: response regulator, partial [Sneathiella sp.]|nr:response regulator [Sneathiella sp.]
MPALLALVFFALEMAVMYSDGPVFKLLRYFSLASGIAIIFVTTVLSVLFWQYATANLSKQTEDQNIILAQSFANIIWPKYEAYVNSVSGLDSDALLLRPETREIHATLKKLTANLPVLKVKLYSLEALTVYSSQFSQIGDSKKGNESFEATIRRKGPTTRSSFHKTFVSFSGSVMNRHLVESYLPIRGPNGQVKGVFELYSDVTPLITEIKQTTGMVVLSLLLCLGLLYAVLYLIVKRADGIIERQFIDLVCEALERQSTEVKYREAETANTAKSEFLAVMSHECRTPLNVILGMAGVLLGSDMSKTHRSHVGTIRDAGQTMLALVNDILDLSKIEAGHIELEVLDFDLNELLETLDDLWQMRLKSKGLDFSVHMASDVVPILRSDPARIRQILFNLIGNADKFTDAGKVTLELSQHHLSGGHLETRFTVTDTGIGIASDMQPSIFKKFTQADSSVTRKYGGTGLGLAICKQLAELLGGEIGFQSIVGDGATFWFTVRCAPGDRKTVNANLFANESDTIRPNEAVEPQRILVAEDNIGNQILIRTLLESEGHRLEMVSDGVEAVSAVRRIPYNLVLMDIQMPQMDGITATAQIRALPGEIGKLPIIALTANAMKSDRET